MTGRPKGHPKSGGRQKGTANKVSATTRERIEKEADPIGFLVNVVNGKPIEVAVGLANVCSSPDSVAKLIVDV